MINAVIAPARLVLLCAILLLLTGCSSSGHLSPDVVRNAAYGIPDLGSVRFEDGSYDRGTLHLGQIDLFAFGDLDGDGREDAVTFLARSGDGPSIFLSMEAFLNRGGVPVHAGGARIGDRIAIDSLSIEKRIVNIALITQGPGDSICCPTLHVRREYAFENGSFVEVSVRENK